MGVVKASSIYLRHPKVFSTFGIIGAVAGTVQDVFIEYASFGNLIALASIGLFVLIATASALGADTIVKRKVGTDWPGVGLATTALFALLMAGTYYWSENNQDSGGVLASNFESIETFQAGIDAMMAELGVIKKDLEALKAKTETIAKDTRVIRESSEEIKSTTSNIRDRIERDPETILKDLNLTLTAKGYTSLLERNYDAETLYPLLEIFAAHDFTLSMDASSMPGMMEFWSGYRQERLGHWPSGVSLIGVRLFLGNLDGPNLKRALMWEIDQGIREKGETETSPLGTYQQIYSTCGRGPTSCFTTHLVRYRNQQDFFNATFTLAHWAALGGREQSLEWLASVNEPLNERNNAGYTPFDIAIETNNPSVATWLLANTDEGFKDQQGISFEILALKAFDGVDTNISPYAAQTETQELMLWHKAIKSRIKQHQLLINKIGRPSNASAIAQRVEKLISPHYQQCVDAVSYGQEQLDLTLASEERTKNRQQYGYENVESLNRVLTNAKKRLEAAVSSIEKYNQESEQLEQKINAAKAKKARAERSLLAIEAKRKRLNILSKEYRATYEPEGEAKAAIINAGSEINMAEYYLQSNRQHSEKAKQLIPDLQSEVKDLSEKRQLMSQQKTTSTPVPRPLLNLESTCEAIKSHLDFVLLN